jgi:hypothetical protein
MLKIGIVILRRFILLRLLLLYREDCDCYMLTIVVVILRGFLLLRLLFCIEKIVIVVLRRFLLLYREQVSRCGWGCYVRE